jgi:hypothetical protein
MRRVDKRIFFSHPFFQRDMPDLLLRVKRKTNWEYSNKIVENEKDA